MLRKRNMSIQKEQFKDHLMSDFASESSSQLEKLGPKQKNSSFFSVPGLFIGLSLKGVSDSDLVRSPTSPLDYKVFAKLSNPRSPGPNGTNKSWDCDKVGLGIIDSLDCVSKSSENVVGLSGSRNILFGSQMRMNIPPSPSRLYRSVDSSVAPNSLPKNYANFPHLQLSSSANSYSIGEMRLEGDPVGRLRSHLSDSSMSMPRLSGLAYPHHKKSKPVFELNGEASNIENSMGIKSGSGSGSLPVSINPVSGLIGPLSAREIELSEDYTCIISHGPNPKTTHIFGDCVLECHTNGLTGFTKEEEQGIGSFQAVHCSSSSLAYPSNDFMSFCYFCKKKLEEGNDIYMYRGEKAFCSSTCRDEEMLVEEEMDDSPSNSPKSTCSDDIFLMGI